MSLSGVIRGLGEYLVENADEIAKSNEHSGELRIGTLITYDVVNGREIPRWRMESTKVVIDAVQNPKRRPNDIPDRRT